MKQDTEPTNKYFQDALSDFVYDAASGRAIRHLTDAGYTASQIVQNLDYPTPISKVRHTITRYLKESSILLEKLPIPTESLTAISPNCGTPEELFAFLAPYVNSDGIENSYLSCPFAAGCSKTDRKLAQALSMLTAREREYLEGIEWDQAPMYHRLDRRMLEIGVQTALYADGIHFYFIRSRKMFRPDLISANMNYKP